VLAFSFWIGFVFILVSTAIGLAVCTGGEYRGPFGKLRAGFRWESSAIAEDSAASG
jgi:hypothetical protein